MYRSLSLTDKLRLRKRVLIEMVNDQLKNISQVDEMCNLTVCLARVLRAGKW